MSTPGEPGPAAADPRPAAAPTPTGLPDGADRAPGGRSRPRLRLAALAGLLLVAVCAAGWPEVGAPWLLGDEFIFIVRNPEVSGGDFWISRVSGLLRFPPVEDLYQPVPLLTYAWQWAVWGDAPAAFRRVDVLLHAGNALLLWWVLVILLRRLGPPAAPALASLLAWGLALLWALHPVLVSTWAADMGRTHLLSATGALLALGLYFQALTRPDRRWLLLPAFAALLVAMLSKPVPGWFLIALALEAALLGAAAALRSWRVWLATLICIAFGAIAYWTSTRVGLVQDAAAGLFGDPLARSALAVWLYVRDLVAPFWLSYWYPPDPRTGWTNQLVWLGIGLAAASAVHAWRAWHRPDTRLVTVGWVWFWAGLLPVIGIVGAREAAAVDRYLYQPLMGLALVLGTMGLRPLTARARRPVLAAVWAATAVLAAAMLLWDLPHVRIYRSTIRRAQRVVQLYPGDPRALEGLAAAFQFAADHPLPPDDLSTVPPGQSPAEYFAQRCIETLRSAAARPDLATYFPGPADRAPFHRRLSHTFKMMGEFGDSLEQAQLAAQLQPNSFFTWLRLAHAYQGLGQSQAAIDAYEHCEERLPESPLTRAVHYTDFGYLLLFELERPDLAFPKFEAAVATGHAPPLAYIGLARCEIRLGSGARGAKLVRQVLDEDPQNALAGLVFAEYHARSHHFQQAYVIYATLVAAYPEIYSRLDWYYEALRGFQSVCGELDIYHEAAFAWDRAARQHPDRREFRSFRVWAVACAGDAEAATWADQLLESDPDNPLACLARMLIAARAGESEAALDWIDRAARGQPVPRASEFERAIRAVELLARGEAERPDLILLQAALHASAGHRERAEQLLDELPRAGAAPHMGHLVSRVRQRLGLEP